MSYVRAKERLEAALRDRDDEAGIAALADLIGSGCAFETLYPVFASKDRGGSVYLANWLVRLGVKGKYLALNLARDDLAMYQVVWHLGALLPDPAVEGKLLELREASVPAIRRAAVMSLGSSSTDASLDAIRSAIHDPEPQVRWTAIECLTKREAWESVGEVAALRHDIGEEVRGSVVGFLCRHPDNPEARALLREMADDPCWEVAEMAKRHLYGLSL